MPTANRLFFALIYQSEDTKAAILSRIKTSFGPVIAASDAYKFEHSNYYEEEMGSQLHRQFVGVAYSPSPETYASLKTWAVEEEKKHLDNKGQRTINIDPGLLLFHNMIFLTTKNFSHRIPLTQDIFAEVSLIFKAGGYHALPWSYPDLMFESVQSFFMQLRKAIPI